MSLLELMTEGINGDATLHGHVSADTLTINKDGLLADPESP